MKSWSWLRIGALLFTFLVARLTFFSNTDPVRHAYFFLVFINAFLYSHFLLAFWASRARARATLSGPSAWFFFLLFCSAFFCVWFLPPELSFTWFGVHFAFSEVYSPMLIDFGAATNKEGRPFRTAHIFFFLTTYFLATGHTLNDVIAVTPDVWSQINRVIYFSVAAATVNYVYQLFKMRNSSFAFVYGPPEILFLCLALLAHIFRIHWTVTALYHISFWFIFQWFGNKSIKSVGLDLLSTAAIMGLAISLFPSYSSESEPFAFTPEILRAIHLNMNLGTFHIFMSFALSSLNPKWIRGLQSRL